MIPAILRVKKPFQRQDAKTQRAQRGHNSKNIVMPGLEPGIYRHHINALI
jgi:hypothetical protein